MSSLSTDDEVVAGDCIGKEIARKFTSSCAAKLHYKRRMCALAIKRRAWAGSIDACLADKSFVGATVRGGGIGG